MKKYEQLGTAGEGAYGVVLKCKHKETGDVVAIKKFRESDEDDEESKRLTQREVKLLRALNHKNIVQLREAFRQKGILYLVFDYVEKNLMDMMQAHPGGVGIENVRKLTGELCQALEYCHRRNVIHRDIKPENLLINSNDNSLRLCDFGSACKFVENAVLTDYVSTRWYRAPELLVRSNDYDASVDMWACGCVVAELTVGNPLFAGQTDLDQLCIIHKTLGPLTPEQSKRCMQLTDFGKIRFPPSGEPETLQKRLGHSIVADQMQLLERVIVIDPTQRLTARAVLSTPWLRGTHAPLPESAATAPVAKVQPSVRPPRPQSEQSDRESARAASSLGLPLQKPRVQRSVSPFCRQLQPANNGQHDASSDAGFVAARSPATSADQIRTLQSPPPELPDWTRPAANGNVAYNDPCEASIEEDINDMPANSFSPQPFSPQMVVLQPGPVVQAGYNIVRSPGADLSTKSRPPSSNTSSLPPTSGLKKCVRPVGGKSVRGSSLTHIGA